MPARKTSPQAIARRRLLNYIKAMPEARGARLPPERELCETLDLNICTMKKALRVLAQEGVLSIEPRKGNFLLDVPRSFKVALVLSEAGRDSVFVRDAGVMEGLFSVFKSSRCSLHFVYSRTLEDAVRTVEDYDFDFALWCMFEFPFQEGLKAAVDSCEVPSALISGFCPSDRSLHMPGLYFSIDHRGIGRVRAEFMLKRGHKAVACLSHLGGEAYEGFVSALAQAGISRGPAWQMELSEIAEKLPALLDQGEATAIIMDGSLLMQRQVFEIVERHPRRAEIELMIDFSGYGVFDLIKAHPGVKVVALSKHPSESLGRVAATSVVAFLQDGVPLKPLCLVSEMLRPDGTPFEQASQGGSP